MLTLKEDSRYRQGNLSHTEYTCYEKRKQQENLQSYVFVNSASLHYENRTRGNQSGARSFAKSLKKSVSHHDYHRPFALFLHSRPIHFRHDYIVRVELKMCPVFKEKLVRYMRSRTTRESGSSTNT